MVPAVRPRSQRARRWSLCAGATPADRLSALDSKVGQLEDRHNDYVDRLARLRDRVLSEIDAAIAD